MLRVPTFLIGNVSEHKKTVKPMASPFCCFGLFSGFFFCFRCFSSRSFCFGSSSGSCGFCFSSGSSRSLTCDNAFRAFVCTDTARFTFAVIDYCHVVDNMDCIERTVLFHRSYMRYNLWSKPALHSYQHLWKSTVLLLSS